MRTTHCGAAGRRAQRACEGAARGKGPPQATEPGCGAEPHVRMSRAVARCRALSQYLRELRRAARRQLAAALHTTNPDAPDPVARELRGRRAARRRAARAAA